MGDRGSIVIFDRRCESDESQPGIYLYTHWNGTDWPELLRRFLDLPTARNRWDDPSYLTRILVSHLFYDLGGGETGGGIATFPTNIEHEQIVVDMARQEVAFCRQGSEESIDNWYGELSFEKYCAQDIARYPADRMI